MSSNKTLASEFAAALAALKLPYQPPSFGTIGNTTPEHHKRALEEWGGSEMVQVYEATKHVHKSALLEDRKVTKVNWLGDDTNNAIASRDLELITVPKGQVFLSVKLNSNMIWNKSPHTALNDFWFSNVSEKKRAPDYYLTVAPAELQDYFVACGGPAFTGCKTIQEYYKTRVKKAAKRAFSAHAKAINTAGAIASYASLCRKVSQTAAATITENIAILGIDPTRMVLPMWAIFRLNNFPYILTGVDNQVQLCMQVPSAAKWEENYSITSISAVDAMAGQPQVNITFTLRDKRTQQEYEFEIFFELRWSHGKFCGKPESKIQKRFNYSDLPWLIDLR